MCLELRNMMTMATTITAAELETLLAKLDVDVLADTIEKYWTPVERYVVLEWIGAMLAARKLDDNRLVPNMPPVLVPFYDASRRERQQEKQACTLRCPVESLDEYNCTHCVVRGAAPVQPWEQRP